MQIQGQDRPCLWRFFAILRHLDQRHKTSSTQYHSLETVMFILKTALSRICGKRSYTASQVK